jgi:hypothetical protein
MGISLKHSNINTRELRLINHFKNFRMKRTVFIFIFNFLLYTQGLISYSQVRISGPACVVPGTEYQYELYGKFDKQSEINICVEGGMVAANNNSCYKVSNAKYVRIIWSEDIAKGNISITSATGKGSFSVRPTRALQGGKIDTLLKVQRAQSAGVSKTINCSPGIGGSCNPSFSYQWQQSDDNLHWKEIKGEVFQNLSYSPKSGRAVFLRRKIMDTVSNSIAYSDVAVIVVSNLSGTN